MRQEKPHAKDAKGAKSDEKVFAPDFPSPFSEWICQAKFLPFAPFA